MIVQRSVPSACLVHAAILLSHTGLTVARTLGLDNDDFSGVVRKRNSIWSKTSVDSPIGLDCYNSSCHPGVTGCLAMSQTLSSFVKCDEDFLACIVQCSSVSTGGESSMK